MIRFRPFHFAAIILGLLSLAAPSEAGAQYTSAPLRFEKDPTQTFFSNGHLELGLDVGTTGLGLELATPVTDWMRVRAIPRQRDYQQLQLRTSAGASWPIQPSHRRDSRHDSKANHDRLQVISGLLSYTRQP